MKRGDGSDREVANGLRILKKPLDPGWSRRKMRILTVVETSHQKPRLRATIGGEDFGVPTTSESGFAVHV